MSVYNPDDFLFYYSGAERRARVAAGDPSFSRSSTAMRRDRSEIMREVDEGAYRRNWVEDENGFLVPANRLEAARTNSILHSEDFSDAAWSTVGTPVITTDDAVAPDGTTTADKIEDTDTDSDGLEGVGQSVSVSDDSLDRAASVFLKKGPSQICTFRLLYTGGTLATYELQVNPSDGSHDVSNSDDVPTRYGVEDYNADWWRLWVVGANNNSDNTTVRCAFFPASTDALGNDFKSGQTGAQHVWGAQLEGVSGGASFPSSYLQTTDSAVSRAADDLSFPMGADPQEWTWYVKFRDIGTVSAVTGLGICGVGDNFGKRFEMRAGGGVKPRLAIIYNDGSSTNKANPGISTSVGDIIEARGVLSATEVTSEVYNATTDRSASQVGSHGGIVDSFPNNDLHVGARAQGGDQGFNDFIAGPIIAPGVRTMDECRALAGTA